jgi:septal ring factor EnvC (AmiA/AmiB activator)
VAEEVAEICPDLVLRDGKGEIYSVRYEAVNAMLLNEFLKEHRKIQQQEATVTQLKSTVVKQEAMIARQQKDFQAAVAQQQKETKALVARLEEQASQIQKVRAQLATAPPSDGGLQVSRSTAKVTSNHGTNTNLQ